MRKKREKGLPFSAMATAKKAPAKKAPAKKAAPVKKAVPAKPAPKADAPKKPPVKPLQESASKAKSEVPEKPELAHGIVAPHLVMIPTQKPVKRKGPALKPLRVIPTPLVVGDGESAWTKSELNDVKKMLEQDLKRLLDELSAAEVEIADLLRDSGDGAGDDQADAGTKTFEREHELSLLNNNKDMVLQCERALERISNGTYGRCESCTLPIGKERLKVFPRATLCMVCKQREERR